MTGGKDGTSNQEARQAGFVRTLSGGILMGIANIIPGVSGGTMILAMGLYPNFVEAVADVTRVRLRPKSLIFLGVLGAAAVAAIFAMVGPITWGLTHHQHVMFALFIGLTLGGVPLLWKEMSPVTGSGYAGAVAGVVVMIGTTVALSQLELPVNFLFLFLGGIVGSAAMVLPGLSGSYLLLALGLYFPITAGLSQFKDALRAMDLGAATHPALSILLPVGLGVLAGIAGLTNVLKVALHRSPQPTMGFLLGLLLGSVYFLYPFRGPGHKDPFEAAAPVTALNVILVIVCIVGGFLVTYRLSRLGDGGESGA